MVNVFGRLLYYMATKKVDIFDATGYKGKQHANEAKDTDEKDDETEPAMDTEWWVHCGAWCRINGVENKVASAFFNLWRSVLYTIGHSKPGHQEPFNSLYTMEQKAQSDLIVGVLRHTEIDATFAVWQPLWSFVFETRKYRLCPMSATGKQHKFPLVQYSAADGDGIRCRVDNKGLSRMADESITPHPCIIALNKNVFRNGRGDFTVLSMCFPCVAATPTDDSDEWAWASNGDDE
jgi:hypothetical protein